MGLFDIAVVLGVSMGATAITEILTYKLVYSRDDYTRAQEDVTRLTRQTEAASSSSAAAKGKAGDKKKDHLQQTLTDRSNALQRFRIMAAAIVGVGMFLAFLLVSHLYDGVPIARLPFVPIGFVSSLSQRGLAETGLERDPRLASASFVFILSTFSTRVLLQRALGLTPREAEGKGFLAHWEERDNAEAARDSK